MREQGSYLHLPGGGRGIVEESPTGRDPFRVLERLATGRSASLFAQDFDKASRDLSFAARDKRILVIGGAGSIGGASVAALAQLRPSALHVIDINENGLAELVRRLRSSASISSGTELRTLVMDFGHPVCQQFLFEQPAYDAVLNFAAIKHVRAERDPYSAVTMLETNILKQARFMSWVARHSPASRYFSVSTDKAADPVSLMGATKRLMEEVVFGYEPQAQFRGPRTSARFANVACSNGSLLQSFLYRIERREPLACPSDTKRYFVSHEEAAHICLLASLLAADGTICIPRLDPRTNLVSLDRLAASFLKEIGYHPRVCHSEAEARAIIKRVNVTLEYPLLLTPRDTSGEKSHEVFLGQNEVPLEIGFDALLAVKGTRLASPQLTTLLHELQDLAEGRKRAEKSKIVELIASAIPAFQHADTGRTLDDRM